MLEESPQNQHVERLKRQADPEFQKQPVNQTLQVEMLDVLRVEKTQYDEAEALVPILNKAHVGGWLNDLALLILQCNFVSAMHFGPRNYKVHLQTCRGRTPTMGFPGWKFSST